MQYLAADQYRPGFTPVPPGARHLANTSWVIAGGMLYTTALWRSRLRLILWSGVAQMPRTWVCAVLPSRYLLGFTCSA